MVIVGAFIVPHGAMILDPIEAKRNAADGFHRTMVNVAKEIEQLQPELIFLTSPHGISLSNDFGIYLNTSAKCNAEWEGKYRKYQCEIQLNSELSKQLLKYLEEKETAISGITAYSSHSDITLRWGDAVPLWFLKHIQTSYIIMSQPMKRLESAQDMIPETITLGNDLRIFFEQLDKRVVALISADLSHTHHKDGPYGFSEKALQCDRLIESWIKSLDDKILLKKVVPLLDEAKVCGFIGLVILQGMVSKMSLQPTLLISQAPSYYGMLIAQYLHQK